LERFKWLYYQYILVGNIHVNFHQVRFKHRDIITAILQCARGTFLVLCMYIQNILQERKIRAAKSVSNGRFPYKTATAGQNPLET